MHSDKIKYFLITSLIVSQHAGFSQTGPGGVGNSSTNEIWLRADSGVYNNAGTNLASNNDFVQLWHDNSGNSNNAIQGTFGFRPQYQTNQVNGFPAIDFDGSDDRILSAGISTSDEATVLVVVRADALTNNNDGIIHAAPSGQSFSTSGNDKSIGMWIDRTSSEPWGRGVQSNNTARSIPTTTAISTGTFYVISNDYDGSDITQYINGTTAGTISYDGTLKSWTDFGIGRQGSETFTGDIAEVIAYTITLNEAQLIIVHNYLKAKYGITLTSNNIYTMDTPGNGNYDYEVAGIGRASSGAITHTSSRGSSIVQISKSGGGLGNNEYLFWGHENGDLSSFGHNDVPIGVEARLGRKWKVSEQGEVGNVDIDFDLTNLGAVTVTDLRLLIDTDGDGDFSNATVYSGASDQGSNVYRFTTTANGDIESGYGFTIATINVSQTPLPITLSEFTCALESDVVQISWTTESEINNEFFEIERSSDLESWSTIHKIPGSGNSRVKIHYSHIDNAPLIGIGYYRLKQTDYDGKISYSNIESVNQSSRSDQITIFPNPSSSNVLFVQFPYADFLFSSYSLYGLDGKFVYSKSINTTAVNSGLFQLLLPNVHGTYLLRLNSGNQSWVEKITID